MMRNIISVLWLPILWAILFSGISGESATLRSMKYTTRSPEAAAAWQKNLRTQLFRILHLEDLVAAPQPIAFNDKILSSTDQGSYILSEHEINSTPTRRIRILLTLPKSSMKSFPAVVGIHGHGGNRWSVYDTASIYKGFAQILAEKNFITISMDVGQHQVYESGRILMGERLWDVMRCVDYLVSLPQVDAARIGCAGLSLGGEMAMWLGAMDSRIAATVSSGFLTIMDQMEHDHCMCWKFDGLRELVDYADIYSLTAPRALQCQNGLKESPKMFYVPIAREALKEIQVIYSDFKCLDQVELDVHNGGHEIDLPRLLAFFNKTLCQ